MLCMASQAAIVEPFPRGVIAAGSYMLVGCGLKGDRAE